MRELRLVIMGLLIALPAHRVFALDDDKALAAALKKQADAWDIAIVKKDRKAIENNMSESFFMIGSNGDTATQSQFVDN